MDDNKQGVNDYLLRTVVEQIKLPLIHIARQAEIAKDSSAGVDPESLSALSEMAIKLIDSYFLSLPDPNQVKLALEPVSLSSVLQTAAYNLEGMAKLYNCEIQLRLSGKFSPVMSHRTRLEAAFTMLGFAFIESQNQPENGKKSQVYLTGYKTAQGLAGGVFSPQLEMTNESLKRGLEGLGKQHQALPELSQTTSAGVFIADALLDNLAAKLRVAHYRKLSGLATTLLPSRQLQLI